MAFVAVDKDGMECVYATKPERNKKCKRWQVASFRLLLNVVHLPEGTIKKVIGRELTWEDEPVELKEE